MVFQPQNRMNVFNVDVITDCQIYNAKAIVSSASLVTHTIYSRICNVLPFQRNPKNVSPVSMVIS